jgi:hypothetical protein
MDEDLRLTEGWRGNARAVMLAGTVEIVADPDTVWRYEERMGEHYLGEQASDPEFLEAVEGETRYLCILTPDRTVSWDYSKG